MATATEPTHNLSERLEFRLTAAEKAVYVRAATAAGISLSAWVRRAVTAAASSRESTETTAPPPSLGC